MTFRREVKAHLRLDTPRKQRINDAVRDQLGVELVDLEPYRLQGSAGSTPCRLVLATTPPTLLFGKIHAMTHVRSDRWAKSARVLLYGRLEDEAAFPPCDAWPSTRTTSSGCSETAAYAYPSHMDSSRCPQGGSTSS